MNTNDIMSQIEMNKAIIQCYFDAYNNKNETIFDEIISSDYIDHGQSAYMGSPGRGIDGARRLEPLAFLWIAYYFRTETGNHAIKLLRK